MKLDTIKFIGLFTILLCFAGGTIAWADIPQQQIRCRGCHVNPGGGGLIALYAGNDGCVYCHSSSDSSTTYELDLGMMGQTVTVPVVYYTGETPPTEYLAGGNFWWVKEGLGGDDTKGHNIFPGEPDNYLDLAPGDPGPAMGCGWDTACHRNLHTTNDMSMPGLMNRQGCTKCHMLEDFSGPTWEGDGSWHSHHRDDSNLVVGSQVYDGNSKGTNGWEPEDGDGYYRFLRGHQSGDGHGACGIEDLDWEATSSSTDHNEYLGFSGTKTSSGSLSALAHTVTGFCCGCHGNFHIEQDGGGDWIRHASDGALCPDGLDGCEMADYIIYDPQTPVARPDLTNWTVPSATVDPVTDMANCLSCHRAHGSPYPKMLRWDMTDTTGKACTTCHTSLKKE